MQGTKTSSQRKMHTIPKKISVSFGARSPQVPHRTLPIYNRSNASAPRGDACTGVVHPCKRVGLRSRTRWRNRLMRTVRSRKVQERHHRRSLHELYCRLDLRRRQRCDRRLLLPCRFLGQCKRYEWIVHSVHSRQVQGCGQRCHHRLRLFVYWKLDLRGRERLDHKLHMHCRFLGQCRCTRGKLHRVHSRQVQGCCGQRSHLPRLS